MLLMLKAPVEGQVKTRLAREIGASAAMRAYKILVEHQIRQVPSEWFVQICYAPREAAAMMREWLGEGFDFLPQSNGDLGQRLTAAVDRHFLNNPSPLIVIGGDCPYLNCEMFLKVNKQLDVVDAVLVPAVDGGYCLIALRKPQANVFYAIRWSSETVMAETRDRMRASGLSWHETEVLEDVDDGPSWKRALTAFPDLENQLNRK